MCTALSGSGWHICIEGAADPRGGIKQTAAALSPGLRPIYSWPYTSGRALYYRMDRRLFVVTLVCCAERSTNTVTIYRRTLTETKKKERLAET